MWEAYALKRRYERWSLPKTIAANFELKPCWTNQISVFEQKHSDYVRIEESKSRFRQTKGRPWAEVRIA
jgi:hypothetical protein